MFDFTLLWGQLISDTTYFITGWLIVQTLLKVVFELNLLMFIITAYMILKWYIVILNKFM